MIEIWLRNGTLHFTTRPIEFGHKDTVAGIWAFLDDNDQPTFFPVTKVHELRAI